MKKYVGRKEVLAEPMTREKAMGYGYRVNPKSEENDGYEVQYKDGYKSWCPKEAFEHSYKPISTPLEEVREEIDSLEERLQGLAAQLFSPDFEKFCKEDPMTGVAMIMQRDAMHLYIKNLFIREDLLVEKEKGAPEEAPRSMGYFTISEALAALDLGYKVRREMWDKGEAFLITGMYPHTHPDSPLIPASESEDVYLYNPEDASYNLWIPEQKDIRDTDWIIIID